MVVLMAVPISNKDIIVLHSYLLSLYVFSVIYIVRNALLQMTVLNALSAYHLHFMILILQPATFHIVGMVLKNQMRNAMMGMSEISMDVVVPV